MVAWIANKHSIYRKDGNSGSWKYFHSLEGACRIPYRTEPARFPARGLAIPLGAFQQRLRLPLQTGVPGDPHDIAHAMGFAPPPPPPPAKTTVAPQPDLDLGPAGPQRLDPPRQNPPSMARRIHPARAQVAHQPVPTAEHVQGQITGTIIVSMKEPFLLLSVQQCVRGVKIQNQPTRRCRMGRHELLKQAPREPPPPPADQPPSAVPGRDATPRDRSSPRAPGPERTLAA